MSNTFVALTASQTLTNKTLTSPVVNGSPTGTGIPTITQKTGSGSGNYTTSSGSYSDVDGTNLAYTVTVPTGWKAHIIISGAGSIGVVATGFIAITDGTTLLRETFCNGTANASWSAQTVFTGDDGSHTFKIRFKSDGVQTLTLINTSSTLNPVMTVALMPSN